MAPQDPREAHVAFLLSFKQLALYKDRYEVWRDFVIMAACSLHNGLFKDQAREEECFRINAAYKPEDQQQFPIRVRNFVPAAHCASRPFDSGEAKRISLSSP